VGRGSHSSGRRAQHRQPSYFTGTSSDRSRGRYVGEKHHYEQYTTAHLPTAPGVGQQVTLTKIDLIK